MFRTTLKTLLARKLRLALSALAIVLGVAFVSGALTVSSTLGDAFSTAYDTAYGDIGLQVTAKAPLADVVDTAAPKPLDAATVAQVQGVSGVGDATGVVRVPGARLIGRDGKVPSGSTQRFGQAWDDEWGAPKLRDGHAPQTPDEIVINAALADKTGFHTGDKVGVLTLQPRREFTIAGIVEYDGRPDFVAGEQTVSFTEATAQELMLGKAGAYSAVNVGLAPGKDATAVKKDVSAALGAGFEVHTGKELAEDQAALSKGLLTTITSLLLGFAAVAVLVGVFLIVNAFSVVVAQRTRELALLRAMGASRKQVRRSVLLEAGLVGLVAWVVGAVLGLLLGRLVAGLVADDDSGLSVSGFAVPVLALVVSFLLGVGVTMLAAIVPAVRASRVPPVAAMREAAAAVVERPGRKQTIVGLVLLVIGVALLALGIANEVLPALFAGVLFAFVATAILIPAFTRPVVNVLAKPVARSTAARLGWLNAVRHPRRTAATAASLMIGVALVAGMSTVMKSLQGSATEAVNDQLSADLSIVNLNSSGVPPTVSPAALQQIRGLPDVASVAGYAAEYGEVDGKKQYLLSWDNQAAAAAIVGMKFIQGSADGNGVMMNETTAERLKLKSGDQVKVQMSHGDALTLPVTGVYRDTTFADRVTVPWSAARTGFRTDQPSQAYIDLKDGVSADKAKPAVESLLAGSPEVEVQTKKELIATVGNGIGTIILIVQLLLAVAMIIAILGVVNILVLSVLERTRELGMLRSVGMFRGQLRRMVTTEAVLISLFGALIGVVLGTVLGIAVVKGLRGEGITALSVPWALLVAYLFAALVVGWLAALGPGGRAAKLKVLEAISYE
jgi:putative ABC transport system permease protein